MTINVRIAAIAKDEGAYLPQWIYHHFYFGFNSIDIYVNQTTDNSADICKKISSFYNVRVQDGDALVSSHGANFQKAAYEHAFEIAKKEGVTHLMFIDIDEFWTPLDFTMNVHEHIEKYKENDVLCYEWAIPSHDDKPFSLPFSTSQKLLKNYHLKCLFNTGIDVNNIGIHNVISVAANYAMADGSSPRFDSDTKATIFPEDTVGPLKEVFVLHRVARSQVEYISLLGKGRPSTKNKLKNNRWGFINSNSGVDFNISEQLLNNYTSGLSELIAKSKIDADINSAVTFVMDRFRQVVLTISSAENEDLESNERLLSNIELRSVLKAMDVARFKYSADLDGLIDEDLCICIK
ncbi:glycosyltransferase family 2 protein [Aeromonas hydrophila]|uniref:glycosyltransferase family 2 protein n=1 Tax=Aeromonas hydrophila TaxID=644 RepID=UPI0009BB6A59|nr:glycosyltransferase family 2 protein [Aeromonas hydrophila]